MIGDYIVVNLVEANPNNPISLMVSDYDSRGGKLYFEGEKALLEYSW